MEFASSPVCVSESARLLGSVAGWFNVCLEERIQPFIIQIMDEIWQP